MRPFGILLAMLVAAGCAIPPAVELEPDRADPDGKADGLPDRLRLVDRHKVHADEPSDLAIWDHRLYVVSDQHSKIYEIDDDGDVLDKIDISGRDLEALAIDDAGEFYVGDEARSRIWHLDGDGARIEAYELDANDGNSGIEGLAFEPGGHLFVAKEKDPARIYELDTDGSELARTKITFARDLSALAYNPEDGHLYALSDEDRTLFRLDQGLDWELAWRLPIDKPEGLAFDGSTVYIVSDSEERLYVFELD